MRCSIWGWLLLDIFWLVILKACLVTKGESLQYGPNDFGLKSLLKIYFCHLAYRFNWVWRHQSVYVCFSFCIVFNFHCIFHFYLIFVAFIIVQQFLSLTNCPTPSEPEWKCFKLAKVSYILVVPFNRELFSLSRSTYVHYLKKSFFFFVCHNMKQTPAGMSVHAKVASCIIIVLYHPEFNAVFTFWWYYMCNVWISYECFSA